MLLAAPGCLFVEGTGIWETGFMSLEIMACVIFLAPSNPRLSFYTPAEDRKGLAVTEEEEPLGTCGEKV